jgi:hypothetical protein
MMSVRHIILARQVQPGVVEALNDFPWLLNSQALLYGLLLRSVRRCSKCIDRYASRAMLRLAPLCFIHLGTGRSSTMLVGAIIVDRDWESRRAELQLFLPRPPSRP